MIYHDVCMQQQGEAGRKGGSGIICMNVFGEYWSLFNLYW